MFVFFSVQYTMGYQYQQSYLTSIDRVILPDDDNEDDLMPGSLCKAIPGMVNIDTAGNQNKNH